MPTIKTPRSHNNRDSWPPTQVFLHPSIEHGDAEIGDLDLSYIDHDPLNYFLTPAPTSSDDIIDAMDFDAGIEDSKRPTLTVRSVSPSSLDGLSRLSPRPTTPPRGLSPLSEPDVDMVPTPEDDEQYICLGPNTGHLPLGLPFSLRDYARARNKSRNEKGSKATLEPPSPAQAHPSVRGRPAHRPGLRAAAVGPGLGLPQKVSARSPPHAWREPSPDVWAIEEEPEDDAGEMDGSTASDGDAHETQALEIPAVMKPKKKVRFVLPARDIQVRSAAT